MSIHDRVPVEQLSHWYHSFPPLKVSPQQFYDELVRRIQSHEFPSVETGLIEFRESGVLSAKRRYLRVMRGELAFDICGAPFGNRLFFVSCRLGRVGMSGCGAMSLGCLAMIPGLGLIAEGIVGRNSTCYEADTALVFCDAIQSIVTGYLDELCGAEQIAPLSESERRPSMRKLTEPA